MSQNGKEPLKLPVLFVDVDGVLSVFGFPHDGPPPGRMHSVDGIPHCLVHGCGERLITLSQVYELVWATGWEDRANEHLPHLLGIPRGWHHLTFPQEPLPAAHWKLSAIEAYAGPDRPVAWIDDAHDDSCHAWADQREGPTLLVATDPAVGITGEHVETLLNWGRAASG